MYVRNLLPRSGMGTLDGTTKRQYKSREAGLNLSNKYSMLGDDRQCPLDHTIKKYNRLKSFVFSRRSPHFFRRCGNRLFAWRCLWLRRIRGHGRGAHSVATRRRLTSRCKCGMAEACAHKMM